MTSKHSCITRNQLKFVFESNHEIILQAKQFKMEPNQLVNLVDEYVNTFQNIFIEFLLLFYYLIENCQELYSNFVANFYDVRNHVFVLVEFLFIIIIKDYFQVQGNFFLIILLMQDLFNIRWDDVRRKLHAVKVNNYYQENFFQPKFPLGHGYSHEKKHSIQKILFFSQIIQSKKMNQICNLKGEEHLLQRTHLNCQYSIFLRDLFHSEHLRGITQNYSEGLENDQTQYTELINNIFYIILTQNLWHNNIKDSLKSQTICLKMLMQNTDLHKQNISQRVNKINRCSCNACQILDVIRIFIISSIAHKMVLINNVKHQDTIIIYAKEVKYSGVNLSHKMTQELYEQKNYQILCQLHKTYNQLVKYQ